MRAKRSNPTPNLSLNLSFSHTESALQRFLEERLGRPLALILTDNATSMLSARGRDGILHVRLHRMFLEADNRVLDEIVSFLAHKRGAMPCFRAFVRDREAQLRQKPPKKVRHRTRGKFHDLRELCDEVNREYFGGMIKAAITWGAASSRFVVRKRTLGSYSERSHTIRISPLLDRKTVPRYYLSFIVYHEMLHAALGVSRRGGRRSVHSAEFRKRERLFKDYERALAWELGR